MSIRRQCELLRINRAGLYYQPAQPSPKAIEEKERLMARLDFWHTTLPCSGSRKLAKLLREEGLPVGRKRIRRFMEEMGLHVIYPKVNLSKRDFRQAVVPYLLRNMDVCYPNQV